MVTEEQMYRHLIKLLDEEDRHTLFEILIRFTKGNKWQTAAIMGVSKSQMCQAFDERRKKPYVPSPETSTRIFVYLVRAAAIMDNSENEFILNSGYPLTKEVKSALKDYRSKAKEYDAYFADAWSKIIQKLKAEGKAIQASLSAMNLHDSLPDPAQSNKLICTLEQLKARTDALEKLCAEKTISQPSDPAVLEVIAKFPEDKWLLLLDKASHLRLTPKQIQSYGDFLISSSNKGPRRSVMEPP